MLTRRFRLRRAALRYAAQGWPVAPAIDYQISGWPGTGINCSCRYGQQCPQPGAHPAHELWRQSATTDPTLIRGWWSGQAAPNVLLAPGETFDAWLAPARLGSLTAGLIERELATTPVACTAQDNWVFFTQPASSGASLHRMGVRRLTLGDYLVAPPSWHGAWRRDRWFTPPHADDLPPWEPVALLLIEAARRLDRLADFT